MKKLVLWAILFISTASFAENETSVRLYRPFTAGVQQPGIQVAKVLTGYCDMQSEVMPREDAWRCTSDSQTFDPCFIKPGKDPLIFQMLFMVQNTVVLKTSVVKVRKQMMMPC